MSIQTDVKLYLVKQGIIGFIVLILGIAILAILMVLVQVKLLGKSTNPEVKIEDGSGESIPTSTRPKDVQNKVNDLQNQLQQNQNQSLGVE